MRLFVKRAPSYCATYVGVIEISRLASSFQRGDDVPTKKQDEHGLIIECPLLSSQLLSILDTAPARAPTNLPTEQRKSRIVCLPRTKEWADGADTSPHRKNIPGTACH